MSFLIDFLCVGERVKPSDTASCCKLEPVSTKKGSRRSAPATTAAPLVIKLLDILSLALLPWMGHEEAKKKNANQTKINKFSSIFQSNFRGFSKVTSTQMFIK